MSDNNIKSQSLPWTGERYLPEVQGNIELEHLHRYLFATQLSLGKRVLDIASGEGYGSALLAQSAASVVGVDIAAEAIAHATTKYQAGNLEYRLGSCAAIPLADHSVDVVVSFETIEHHYEHDAMLHEIKRVLIPGGLLIISSPDKLEYSERPSYNNPYHVKELYRGEFKSLLRTYFKHHYIAGQRVIYGSVIFGEDGCSKIRSYDLSDKSLHAVPGVSHAVYLVAIASDDELPLTESGILEQPISRSEAVQESAMQIANLHQAVGERDGQLARLNQASGERDGQINSLHQAVGERDGQLARLNQALSERDGQINSLHQAVGERDGQLARLNQALGERDGQINSLHQAVGERDGQLARLNQMVAERDGQVTILNQIVGDCDEQIAKLNQLVAVLNSQIASLISSKSFFLTKPLRFFGRVMRGELETAMAPFVSLRANNPVNAVCQIRDDIESLTTIILTRKEELAVTELQTVTMQASEVADRKPEIPRIEFDQTRDQFVEYQKNPHIHPLVKLIAFYLPQFHPFPENDEWWGKGFTEWTNVGKALPNYVGHYQPHCPIHHGYYDLRVPEVMEEQARLAKEYGIYGFSYYFYWFDGKIMMDMPLELMLANKKVDIPFCLTWANENWSRRWDGQENDILIAQNHSDEDSLAFIRHLVKYFKDERYIRIDGKPILIIYRADIIPNMSTTAKIWRDEMVKHGIPGLYLVSAQTFGILTPEEFNFDASVEFPPHTVLSGDIENELELVNPEYNGHIYSYEQAVANAVLSKEPDYKLYRTVMLSWDNTARKQNNSHIFHDFSLLRYKQWLSSIVNKVHSNLKYTADEKIVFVNAWNEWAEGTHLEPDQKCGYGYLQTTYDVLRDYDSLLLTKPRRPHAPIKKSDYAVILHLHYDELWPDIRDYLVRSISDHSCDLYVSVTSSSVVQKVLEDFPDAYIELVENRGRDILPFIRMLKVINNMGYTAVCKIHSKRSVYRNDGDNIRDEMFDALMGSNEQVEEVLSRFRSNARLGMVAPENYLVEHNDHNMTFDKEVVQRLASHMHIKFMYDIFPAGSMFWFSPSSLDPLLVLDDTFFAIESGLADGTCAHAVERLFCQIVKNRKYTIESC